MITSALRTSPLKNRSQTQDLRIAQTFQYILDLRYRTYGKPMNPISQRFREIVTKQRSTIPHLAD